MSISEFYDSSGKTIIGSSGINFSYFKRVRILGTNFSFPFNHPFVTMTNSDLQDCRAYYVQDIGIRLWDIPITKHIFLTSPDDPNRYSAIMATTPSVEVFSSLPSTSGYPSGLVIQVGGTYYRLISGSWTSISAGSITSADKELYYTVRVIITYLTSDTLGTSSTYPNGYIYVIGLSSNIVSSGYGLEMYDDSSNLVFSSNNYYANYAGIFSAADVTFGSTSTYSSFIIPNNAGSLLSSYSSSKRYAHSFICTSYNVTSFRSGIFLYFNSGLRINSSTLEYSALCFQAGITSTDSVTGQGPKRTIFSPVGFVFDVTGLT